ncbi:MAG: DUF2812 domain-containing protein, partial [Erysipelotrichales bacterium]|nr:DUF2812 domain-containing protein [Erysipelotrichales bacterium]
MRKKFHKWFWVWDVEKEEQWLNMMAQSGWVLDKVGLATYDFISCDPGEYTIRLEMREHDEAYLDLMREMGAEYIGRVVQWTYYRKRAALGEFDIFSDIDSKIHHLTKIGNGLAVIALGNLLIALINSINPVVNISW